MSVFLETFRFFNINQLAFLPCIIENLSVCKYLLIEETREYEANNLHKTTKFILKKKKIYPSLIIHRFPRLLPNPGRGSPWKG